MTNLNRNIQKIRLKRNLTMKQLGIDLAFNPKIADVRISQYESGVRTPKSKLISAFADELFVSEDYIKHANNHDSIMFSLFEMQDEWGIPFLENLNINMFENMPKQLKSYIEDWLEIRKEVSDNIKSYEDYEEWKLNWKNY